MADFPGGGQLPEELLYLLTLVAPISVIIVCEMALICMYKTDKPVKVNPLCESLRVPRPPRRVYRILLNFVFAYFFLMLTTDVLKALLGVPRPHFLGVCRPTLVTCSGSSSGVSNGSHGDGSGDGAPDLLTACTEGRLHLLKDASTSCPSMLSCLVAYSTTFLILYFHGLAKVHGSKYTLVPTLTGMLALVGTLGCAGRVLAGRAWWSDAAAGAALGVAGAVYMGLVVHHGLSPKERVSNRRLLRRLMLARSGGAAAAPKNACQDETAQRLLPHRQYYIE